MFQNIIEVLILSAIQGVSEFLPISSSAHLILVSSLYEFKSSSLLIDISLHLGSLFAIVYYFKEELLNINKNKRLISLIVIGSIPLIIFGYFLYTTGLIYSLRNIETIAWTTLIFAIVLYISDKSRFDKKISSNLNIQSILFIGMMQILSLIPGVSRSGIAITAARFLNFKRIDSAKISFLISIPILGAVSIFGLRNIFFSETYHIAKINLFAIIFSFFFSLITIKFFLKYLSKFSLNIFVYYRVILGVILLAFAYL